MNSKIEIVLADLFYINRLTQNRLCVPLNVGYIAAYTKILFGNEVNLRIFKDAGLLLEHLRNNKPDLVGFSFYYWNTNLNYHVVEQIRKKYGNDVVVAFGGPSIDSIEVEQKKLIDRFPDVDVFIEGEGEDGFSKLVERMLTSRISPFESPIDCSFFQKGSQFIKGINTSKRLNLNEVPSPYLTGHLDEFVERSYFPLLQATRTCPYQCTFCVAGKDRSKLRAFPLDQVKQEIDYIAYRYKDKPHIILNLAELNFGINKQDPEISEYLRDVSKKVGYPSSVYFYSDKKFGENSKKVIQALGKLNKDGLVFSLQTDHPDALAAINRKNLSDENIQEGIEWAKGEKVPVTTEVIFGLPYETFDSMVALLNKSVAQGFDSIMLHNLFVMEGVELNREAEKLKHEMKTKYRLLGSNYMMIGDDLVYEYEQLVTENKYFNFDDFIKIRCLNLMFFSVFQGGFYKYFFQYVNDKGVALATFFHLFMSPDTSETWPDAYIKYVEEFRRSSTEELYDDLDSLALNTEKIYKLNNDIGEPTRLNPYFFSRLMYSEQDWIGDVLKKIFLSVVDDMSDEELIELDKILDLSKNLIIDLKEIKPSGGTFNTNLDLNGWREDKFHASVNKFKVNGLNVCLKMTKSQEEKLKSFRNVHTHLEDRDIYFSAAETIFPRSDLFYKLDNLNSQNSAVHI